MTDVQSDTWAELEARAQRLLEHPKELEPREPIRRFGSVLRLWHSPAYGPPSSLTVLAPGRKALPGALPLVREVVWDRAADQQREAASQPTMRVRDADLPAAELQSLLESGANLAVPLLGVRHTVGVDGEFFGLETYEVSPNVRLQWWCAGPVEWRHFLDWVSQLRVFLHRHLDELG